MDDTKTLTTGRLFRVSRRRATRVAVVLLLTAHTTLLAWQAWRYSPTIDEPGHLVAGLSHWKFGRFDLYRVNPPLVRLVAALPMLIVDPKADWSAFSEAPYARPEFNIGTAFANANGFETFWHVTLARWICIPFSLVGGYFCYRWACDLYGAAAGIMALALWCFCPNILGNGALITPDVPAAAFGVMGGYFFWRWLSCVGVLLGNPQSVAPLSSSLRPPSAASWPRAMLAGLTLGLAELTKSTWIILFALWPLIWLFWKCRRYPAAVENPKFEILNSKFTQLCVLLLLALYILNLGYGFENSFQPLDKFQFISRALGGLDAHEKPGNRFANTWLGAIPVPLPANYLSGIDVQRYDFEVGKWSYLRGEQKMGGWWYYYLYAMAVKMPAGTLFLIALAAATSAARTINAIRKPTNDQVGCASRLTKRNSRSTILDSVVVLAPALALIVVVSSQTGFNRYFRYVVPAFPFLFVWTSQVARLLPTPRIRGLTPPARQCCRSSILHILSSIAVLLPLLASIASSLAVFPNSLSYFNELAGGPENGPAHLLDANIDWGQNLLELKRWYDAHPEARPFRLAYVGCLDPRTAGIQFDAVRAVTPSRRKGKGAVALPSVGSPSAGTDSKRIAPPGWYALSVNDLHGYKHFGDRPDQYAGFRSLRPTVRVGYSIIIFHTTGNETD